MLIEQKYARIFYWLYTATLVRLKNEEAVLKERK